MNNSTAPSVSTSSAIVPTTFISTAVSMHSTVTTDSNCLTKTNSSSVAVSSIVSNSISQKTTTNQVSQKTPKLAIIQAAKESNFGKDMGARNESTVSEECSNSDLINVSFKVFIE